MVFSEIVLLLESLLRYIPLLEFKMILLEMVLFDELIFIPIIFDVLFINVILKPLIIQLSELTKTTASEIDISLFS